MSERLRCELIGLDQVYDLSWELAAKVRRGGFRPEVVIAVARGGFVPARFVCDFLGVSDLASVKVQHYAPGAHKEARAWIKYPLGGDVSARRVLVVDDVNDTGDTLRVALEHLALSGAREIRTACLHEKVTTGVPVNFKVVEVRDWHWIIYPWAVVEDVSGFLRRLPEVPTLEAAERLLAETYEIRLPRHRLEMILALLGDG